jgi:hypothetical protein
MFKKVRTGVTEESPSTSTSDAKLEEARAVVLDDRKITIAEMAQKLNAR